MKTLVTTALALDPREERVLFLNLAIAHRNTCRRVAYTFPHLAENSRALMRHYALKARGKDA
jgi:hypothetical protein